MEFIKNDFEKFDVDKDGFLDHNELINFHSNEDIDPNDEDFIKEIEKIMKLADENGDKKISMEELIDYMNSFNDHDDQKEEL